MLLLTVGLFIHTSKGAFPPTCQSRFTALVHYLIKQSKLWKLQTTVFSI